MIFNITKSQKSLSSYIGVQMSELFLTQVILEHLCCKVHFVVVVFESYLG